MTITTKKTTYTISMYGSNVDISWGESGFHSILWDDVCPDGTEGRTSEVDYIDELVSFWSDSYGVPDSIYREVVRLAFGGKIADCLHARQ